MIFSRTFHECLCIAQNVFAVSIVKSAVYVRKRYVFTFSLFPSIRIRVGSISQFSCVRLFVLIPSPRHVELRASCTAHGVGKCYIVQWSVASLKHLFLLHRHSRMRHTRFTYIFMWSAWDRMHFCSFPCAPLHIRASKMTRCLSTHGTDGRKNVSRHIPHDSHRWLPINNTFRNRNMNTVVRTEDETKML